MKRIRISDMAREHQFADKDREEWEQIVFEEAEFFTVSRFMGRSYPGKFWTNRHPNILEAVKDAAKGSLTAISEPMLYAVAASGRNVLIPRERWVALITEFAERNPNYEEQK